MTNKTICVPVCKKHTRYRGKQEPKFVCTLCEAIWLLQNQDKLCACDYNFDADCGQ